MMAHQGSGQWRSQAAAAAFGDPPSTLTAEHAQLLTQVIDRSEELLKVAGQDRWPDRELRALAGYLRAEVLRQVSDEEWLLFPSCGAAAGLSRLTRDHVRLRACIDVIAGAASGEAHCSPAEIATTTCDLLTQLRSHFSAEETVLAGFGEPAAATAALGARPHHWYPLTEGPVIDLDVLPDDRVIDAVGDRLRRLDSGEQVELRSSSDPDLLCRRLAAAEHGDYGFTYLPGGPDRWRVEVIRRY